MQCELQYAKVWKPFPANRNNFQWSTDLQNTLRLYPTKTDANQNLAGAIIEDSTGKKVRTTLKISFGGLNQQGQRVNSRAARIYVYFYNDEPTSQDKTQANVRAGNGRYFLALPGDYLIKVVDTPGTGGVSCASQEKVRGSSGPKDPVPVFFNPLKGLWCNERPNQTDFGFDLQSNWNQEVSPNSQSVLDGDTFCQCLPVTAFTLQFEAMCRYNKCNEPWRVKLTVAWTDDDPIYYECKPGYYLAPWSSKCQTCGTGTISAAAATTCTACGAGQYMNERGQSLCKNCPIGSKLSAEDVVNRFSVCPTCSAGKYQDQVGQSSCIGCGEGKHLNPDTLDPPGKVQDSEADCKNCGVGFYQPENVGSKDCFGCATNTVGGAATCDGCQVGEYDVSNDCFKCPKGFFNIDAGAATCKACPIGKWKTKRTNVVLFFYFFYK